MFVQIIQMRQETTLREADRSFDFIRLVVKYLRNVPRLHDPAYLTNIFGKFNKIIQ